jgi:hypothetical protein
MRGTGQGIQLWFIGAVTVAVAVWGSPAEAVAAAAICKALVALAGAAGAASKAEEDR